MNTVLLLLLVFGLLVSPLMLAIPKPDQRRREALRKKLVNGGLKFQLAACPGNSDDSLSPVPVGGWYGLTREQRDELQVLAIRKNQQWQILHCNHCPENKVERLLANFPDYISALRINPDAVAVWWSEIGGIQAAQSIVAVLNDLIQLKADSA